MRATRLIVFLVLSCVVFTAQAETKWDYLTHRNELRVGWGDQLFETLMWHEPKSIITSMPADYRRTYQENFKYHQHLFIEYQYRFNHWCGLGGMVDLSEVDWDDVTRDGRGQEVERAPGHYFYNVTIMPTVRFTYYHHPYVNLYSGLGMGIVINGGTETNVHGNRTETGFAVNITAFGVSANYERYFATVELGGLYGLRNANTIYMASSRIFNASIGVRF